MSLEFRATMDPHSIDVYQGQRFVAMLQWHRERPPACVMCADAFRLTPDEMRLMAARLDEEIRVLIRLTPND